MFVRTFTEVEDVTVLRGSWELYTFFNTFPATFLPNPLTPEALPRFSICAVCVLATHKINSFCLFNLVKVAKLEMSSEPKEWQTIQCTLLLHNPYIQQIVKSSRTAMSKMQTLLRSRHLKRPFTGWHIQILLTWKPSSSLQAARGLYADSMYI